jgi:hypothetical protein
VGRLLQPRRIGGENRPIGRGRALAGAEDQDMRRRELAERRGLGVCVQLWWDPARDEIQLRYEDERLGVQFETVVERTDALDAFYHPNCYRPRTTATRRS